MGWLEIFVVLGFALALWLYLTYLQESRERQKLLDEAWHRARAQNPEPWGPPPHLDAPWGYDLYKTEVTGIKVTKHHSPQSKEVIQLADE
jgi:hypothetical protein